MKNNLLTTNPEEIAKLYLQPLVSNVDGLTVYGGKRDTAPITVFIKKECVKLYNYLHDLNNHDTVYYPGNPDYIDPYYYELYFGRNLTINNVKKILVNNNLNIEKEILTSNYWEYNVILEDLPDWSCILIYGVLEEYEEDGEIYKWNCLNNIKYSSGRLVLLSNLPPESIVILPKYLEIIPKGSSNYPSISTEYTISQVLSIIDEYDAYESELEIINNYGESLGSYLWNCYLYVKLYFNSQTYLPVVYITSDILPDLSNTSTTKYSLKNVKVKFLNSSILALTSISAQYWIDLDLDISELGFFVKFLMNSLTSNSIIVYYKIESTGTHQITLNTSGITGMIVDNGEEELYLGNDYDFTTIGIHKIEFLLDSSYTALGPVFLLIPEASIIILPTQITSFSGTNMFGAFSASKLNYILFPAISNLYSDAIYSTNNTLDLKALIFTGVTPPTIGSTNTFSQLNILSIYVPASAVDTYKTAWPTYTDIIQAIPE